MLFSVILSFYKKYYYLSTCPEHAIKKFYAYGKQMSTLPEPFYVEKTKFFKIFKTSKKTEE
jgi:hypothetical protein